MCFTEETDGIDHINVYSNGQSLLGQQLSNFYPSSFYYLGLKFGSVEAFWYYWKLQNRVGIDQELKHLCSLSGFSAKKYGRGFLVGGEDNPTVTTLKAVYHKKLLFNRRIKNKLMACTLPLTHYYSYGGKRVETDFMWTGELWAVVRKELLL